MPLLQSYSLKIYGSLVENSFYGHNMAIAIYNTNMTLIGIPEKGTIELNQW